MIQMQIHFCDWPMSQKSTYKCAFFFLCEANTPRCHGGPPPPTTTTPLLALHSHMITCWMVGALSLYADEACLFWCVITVLFPMCEHPNSLR